MRSAIATRLLLTLLAAGAASLIPRVREQRPAVPFSRQIPRVWDDEAVASLELPLAEAAASPLHIPADYYYRMAVRPIYKSYPIYAPGREPAGYFNWLRQQEPELMFDPAKFRTERDWIRAGELVFEAPIGYGADPISIIQLADVRNPAWYRQTGTPAGKDGVMPFARYVIRKKGKVEVGNLSCSMCHTRQMPAGEIIKGAQGNFPFNQALAYLGRAAGAGQERDFRRMLYAVPWLHPDPQERSYSMPHAELIAQDAAIPPGVLTRHGTSYFSPVQVPDLIGIKKLRYLDRTGLVRHRGIGDMMRYAALNQDVDVLSSYGGFRPIQVLSGSLPEPATLSRYSDEQLYALALYLYSLQPPPNPNRRTALAERGQRIFQREECGVCHTPPLYTNNKLSPVNGFKVPKDHLQKYDILPTSVGTDPMLALTTRRGTGYYKVTSLKGLWYRGPFEHSGSVATLEDWFDPRRLREDYVPTGFKGYGVKTRAVKGHEFGLKLPEDEKKALIAFLKTL